MLDLLFHHAEEGQQLANSHGSAQGACAKFNIQDRVKEIQAPTLVICGSEDKTFPCRWNEFYEKNLGKVTTKVIKNTSHSVQFEQPEELAKIILEFANAL
jgi:pimeloyl-ACP methyl ester carboxylesterase